METGYKIYKAHRGWGIKSPGGLFRQIFASKREAEATCSQLNKNLKIDKEVNQWVTSYTAQQ